MRRPDVDARRIRQQLAPRALALLVVLAPVARAQTPAATGASRPQIVRVRVTDSVGVPISGADVSILQGLQRRAAQGTTGDDGTRTLTIVGPEGSYDAMVRRIGFARADRFFALRLGRHRLAALRARGDAPHPRPRERHGPGRPETQTLLHRRRRHRQQHASDLRRHGRRDELRPTMMSNPTPGSMDRCGLDRTSGSTDERIALAPINEVAGNRAAGKHHGASFASPRGKPGAISKAAAGPAMESSGDGTRPGERAVRARDDPPGAHRRDGHFMTVTTFRSTRRTRRNALFVVLKPGVAFEPGIGSYVIGPDAGRPGTPFAVRGLAASTASTRRAKRASLWNRYRSRLLGLFDAVERRTNRGRARRRLGERRMGAARRPRASSRSRSCPRERPRSACSGRACATRSSTSRSRRATRYRLRSPWAHRANAASQRVHSSARMCTTHASASRAGSYPPSSALTTRPPHQTLGVLDDVAGELPRRDRTRE